MKKISISLFVIILAFSCGRYSNNDQSSKNQTPEKPTLSSQNKTESRENDQSSKNQTPEKPTLSSQNKTESREDDLHDEEPKSYAKSAAELAGMATFNKSYDLSKNSIQKSTLWDPISLPKTKQDFEKQLDSAGIDKTFQLALSAVNAWGFYHPNNPGSAFANTAKAKLAFSCDQNDNSIKSDYAELCFQAEKLRLLKKISLKEAFDEVTQLKKKNGDDWKNLVNEVNGSIFNILKLNDEDLKNISYQNMLEDQVLRDKYNRQYLKPWFDKSIAAMSRIIARRLKVEPELLLVLVKTPGSRNAIIVENSGKNDAIWGNGGDHRGRNQLGLLYSLIRERFWTDFKRAFNSNFDGSNQKHVEYLLEWIDNYDGT